MGWLRIFISRLWGLFRRRNLDRDLDAEVRAHVEMLTEENIRRGMSLKEARHAAYREFGGVEQAKETCRDQRGLPLLESLLQDTRYGLRMLRKNPGFTVVAVLTLALGIGANTAMFSVMQGVVLAPLQYVNPDRLVMVWENNPRFPRTWVSYPNFRDWQRSARSFQQMAAFTEQGVDFAGPGTPQHLNGKEISSGFFSTLGAELTLGREFSPEEDRYRGTPVAIITNPLWINRSHASPDALGRSITLDGVDYTVVGLTPQGFRLLEDVPEDHCDVYTPLTHTDPL